MATASAAEKRLFLARLANARADSEEESRGGMIAWGIALLLLLAVLCLIGLWLSGFFSTPPEVLEIRALVDKEIVELQKVARNEAPLTFDNPSFRQHWDRMRDMPRETRDQARHEMERLFQAREQAELRSYFSLPPQERQKELDRRIKAEDARRQSRQSRGPQVAGTSAAGGRGGPGGSPAGAGPRTGGQGGGGPAGGGQAGGGQGRGPTAGGGGGGAPGGGQPSERRRGSEDDRNLRSKQRIDSTTPVERAQTAEYRRAMEARRAELGASPGRGYGR